MKRWAVAAGALLLVVPVLAACGDSGSSGAVQTRRSGSESMRPLVTSSTSAAPTTVPATPTTVGGSTASSSLLVNRLIGVGSANQVIAVTANAYGDTTATLTAYQRTGGQWTQAFGPFTARLGFNGFAPEGAKREGDGRTPSGSYGFDFFFGVQANPGVTFSYRPVTGTSIVWDDDSSSPLYNQWVDSSTQNAGAGPEPMYNQPAYNYGAVIAYNAARTPGLGSAIFLHVSTGGSTAGCVSVTQDQLLQLLQWLDPSQQPRIIMGTTAAITTS